MRKVINRLVDIDLDLIIQTRNLHSWHLVLADFCGEKEFEDVEYFVEGFKEGNILEIRIKGFVEDESNPTFNDINVGDKFKVVDNVSGFTDDGDFIKIDEIREDDDGSHLCQAANAVDLRNGHLVKFTNSILVAIQ